MGLFDTFVFEKPVPCPDCGSDIKSVQSKSFGSLMDWYNVGDAIRDCGIRLGIVKEDMYCDSCRGPKEGKRPDVFLVVWHGIYAGAYLTMLEAEARLASVDRATLLGWHERQQNEKEDWSRRFRNLSNVLSEWRDYTLAEDKEAFLKKPFAFIRSDLRTIALEPDPLGAIHVAPHRAPHGPQSSQRSSHRRYPHRPRGRRPNPLSSRAAGRFRIMCSPNKKAAPFRRRRHP